MSAVSKRPRLSNHTLTCVIHLVTEKYWSLIVGYEIVPISDFRAWWTGRIKWCPLLVDCRWRHRSMGVMALGRYGALFLLSHPCRPEECRVDSTIIILRGRLILRQLSTVLYQCLSLVTSKLHFFTIQLRYITIYKVTLYTEHCNNSYVIGLHCKKLR